MDGARKNNGTTRERERREREESGGREMKQQEMEVRQRLSSLDQT